MNTNDTQKSINFLVDLLEDAPAAIAVLRGKNLVYELVNKQYELISGYTSEQLIGKPGRDAIPELIDQGVWSIMDQVFETGKAFESKEFLAQLDPSGTGDLEKSYYNFIATPLYEDGEIAGIFVHAYEITELVESREKVEHQEEQLRAFAENLPVLAWIAESDGSIYWYNKSWFEYTGKEHEEMVGWGWQSVHSPEFLPSVLSRWHVSIDTGLPFEMTFPLLGSDGRFRNFITNVSPYRDSRGNVEKWFGTNTLVRDTK